MYVCIIVFDKAHLATLSVSMRLLDSTVALPNVWVVFVIQHAFAHTPEVYIETRTVALLLRGLLNHGGHHMPI